MLQCRRQGILFHVLGRAYVTCGHGTTGRIHLLWLFFLLVSIDDLIIPKRERTFKGCFGATANPSTNRFRCQVARFLCATHGPH